MKRLQQHGLGNVLNKKIAQIFISFVESGWVLGVVGVMYSCQGSHPVLWTYEPSFSSLPYTDSELKNYSLKMKLDVDKEIYSI